MGVSGRLLDPVRDGSCGDGLSLYQPIIPLSPTPQQFIVLKNATIKNLVWAAPSHHPDVHCEGKKGGHRSQVEHGVRKPGCLWLAWAGIAIR